MSGKMWEAMVAAENQVLWDERRAMVARVPTHYHGDVPSRDPKIDFVGLVDGGRVLLAADTWLDVVEERGY